VPEHAEIRTRPLLRQIDKVEREVQARLNREITIGSRAPNGARRSAPRKESSINAQNAEAGPLRASWSACQPARAN